MSATGVHASALCAACNSMTTNHRCLHPMKRRLLVAEVIGRVRGNPICGPCNFRHGNEGVFRCPLHSMMDESGSEDSEEGAVVSSSVADKENVPVISLQSNKVSHEKVSKVAARGPKEAEYGAKDLLILSQAFIRTLEHAAEGTAKRSNIFWDEVSVAYSALKKQQEAYDSRQKRQNKYNAVLLKGEFLSSDDNASNVEVVIPVRTTSSLQQKWSKFVLPLVTKFIN
jgi:hypothetical protein